MKIHVGLFCGALLLGASGAATAQEIFRDDFNGTSLGPHWQIFANPMDAHYSVGGGRLTVDWLRTPESHGNSAYAALFRAAFEPHLGDFRHHQARVAARRTAFYFD